jgi:hypothetical protein
MLIFSRHFDTTCAKIEALIEPAREYFHTEYANPILERPEKAAINVPQNVGSDWQTLPSYERRERDLIQTRPDYRARK